MRSELTAKIKHIESLVSQVRELEEDEQAFFLDLLLPEPETPEVKQKKTRKKRASKRASGMAAALNRSLEQSRNASTGNAEDAGEGNALFPCADCPHPIDVNIHHKQTADGYHEFKSAA